MFIVLEGIDGSGTTTQREAMAARLREQGRTVHTTAEPSTGPIGQHIRRVLTGKEPMTDPALALLFAADRLEHLEREIRPALERGELVISDRYLLSSLAYQSLGSPLAWVREINKNADRPDLTFFLRVSPQVAEERRHARGEADERFDHLQLQVAAAYERVVQLAEAGDVVTLDAEGDINSITDELVQRVSS